MLKGCAIGCGLIVLTLAIVGGVVAWKGPQFFTFFTALVAQEQARQELLQKWTPPADDAPTDAVFPPSLDGYRRESTDEQAMIPELQIDMAGKHAVYREGPSRIDVYFYRVTHLENEALFARVEKASEEGSGTRTWSKVDLGDDYARVYLWTTRLKQNQLWYSRGRLLIFRTTDEADCEPFIHAFFKAGAAAPPEQVNEREIEPKPADDRLSRRLRFSSTAKAVLG
jgi:hypothetical protein